ncbi:hypothetical protein COY27_04435 [Candidatus Woesearchaeota archaeon CG_4_10_14_0_2_um_filter_33_13]|nr:MAG: hypothetical protein COY27_04435 [Candidatus Woesearchaeota archaeon CG_4_10_14_0_2_um_filter_33_13]
MTFKKISTGIPGLDEVLKGGLRENNSVLISGGPGTGKSIMGMQFLIEGAKKKEKGLCILYETRKEDYITYAEELGLGIKKYIDSGMIEIAQQPIVIKKIVSLDAPLSKIREGKVKRVVLDSLTMFSYIHISEDRDYRKKIIDFLDQVKNVTLVATAEATGPNLDEYNFRPEEFLFDGVIRLTKVRLEASFERVMHVSKMRGQEHEIKVYPFFIDKGGLKIYPDQFPFSLVEEMKPQKSKNKK